MTICFIDGASVFDVVLALTRATPQDSYRMEWDRALEVTAFLINAESARLAPPPNPARPAGGAYGVLLEELKDVLSPTTIDDSIKRDALVKTRNWANKNTVRIRNELTIALNSPQDVLTNQAQTWLDAHITHEWAGHVDRHGALFDREFATPIAKALETSVKDIEQLFRTTSDSRLVADLARNKPANELFTKSKAAYYCCVLLRGRYHEYLAAKSNYHSIVHPIRRSVLKINRSNESIKCEVTNTEQFLTNIVLASAFAESTPQARIKQWARNVSLLRKARDRINLESKESNDAARDEAIEIAKRFQVRAEHRQLEQIIDYALGIGSAALTSFLLFSWDSFMVGGILGVATAKYKFGSLAVSTVTGSRTRLKHLSQLKPGRIDEGK